MSWEAWGDPPDPMIDACPTCEGTGELYDYEGAVCAKCPNCDGTGEKELDDYYADDYYLDYY